MYFTTWRYGDVTRVDGLIGSERQYPGDGENSLRSYRARVLFPHEFPKNALCQVAKSRDSMKLDKRKPEEAADRRRSSAMLKPENQLPITPLDKAPTPRARPTIYNGSYGVVL